MNIIIMGPVGSGKTTQADIISKRLNLPHIQTGEIYRDIAQQDTLLGRRIRAIQEAGGLIDDATTLEVVDRHLKEIKNDFILDGFPRTLVQAQRELFPVGKVIYINVSDSETAKRLLARGRLDDTPATITERLKVYHQETEPILDYYRKQGKLIEIDGSGTIEEVSNLIDQKI